MHRSSLRVALAIALLPAVAFAATISPEVLARIDAGPVDVLVFFRDAEATGSALERTGTLVPRLKRNMAASRALLEDLVGNSFGRADVDELWISNAVAMEADRATVDLLAAHPRVKRIDWDEPVTIEPPMEEPLALEAEGEWTYGLEQLRIPEVRERWGLTGAGVVIGHLDTGIDADHPDLAGKVLRYKNFRWYGQDPADKDGHGTHTAGTIAGGEVSGTKIGVAPGAKLVVGRVIGFSFASQTKALLKGMQWMLDPDGNASTNDQPKVVSMSWHSGSGDQNPFYEALRAYESAGIIPSFSAGNSGSRGLTHPKEFPGNFVTAAVDSSAEVANFSSRGPATFQGNSVKKPDWAAPGVSVLSARTGGGYKRLSGTSMACPHVSGVLALMFEADPDLTPSEARAALRASVVDRGEPGWDGAYGAGTVDAVKAIEAVMEGRKARLEGLSAARREAAAKDLLGRMDRFDDLLE